MTDNDNDGKADPGDTLKYTVGINATGGDATGVTFTDTVDPNTTFVAGTLRTTPLARPDSYTATGNVEIQVPAGSGVLANDQDFDGVGPAISVTAGTFGSAQGGNVTISTDGSFSYNPPAGFEGSDTFTYTLNDNDTPNQTDTGTVTITVSGMIWFINNNAGAAGDGRLTNPFNTLAAFNAVNNGTGNHPAANDNIFVYESATDYVGPVTLLNGQKFIGQDATDTLANIANITLAPNSDALPTTSPGAPIVNITSAGIGITLAQNNILRGFTGGNAATDISGSSFGTANISDVTLNGTGQTLNLTTGTLNGTFGSLSSSNSATTGLSLTSVGGSLTTGSTTVSNPTGAGISVNTSSLALNFANTSVTGSGGTGISLTTNTGAITFGSLTITPDAGQRGLLATDNSQTITTTSGSITTTTGVAVEITRGSGTTPLAMSLTLVSSNGAASGIVMTNTSGSFTVTGNGADATIGGNGTGGNIQNSTGPGINLSGVTNISLTSMAIQSGGDDGIRGLNVNGFTFNRSKSINNGNAVTERGIEITNLLGTNSITNALVTGNAEDNLYIKNGSGTSTLTTSNSTYANVSSTIGNDGIQFLAADVSGSNNANMSITVTNCTFNNNRGDHFQASTDAASSATQTVVFQNNSLTGDGGSTLGGNDLGGGITLNPSGTATVNFNISNNGQSSGTPTNQPWTGAVVSAITINSSSNSTMSGTINNNIIGNAAVVDSGSAQGDGINITANNSSDITVAITNNLIRQYANLAGLNLSAVDGLTDTLNATITGNTISNPGSFANNGIFAQAGAATADTSFMCIDIGGAGALANSIAGSSANGGTDFRVRQRFGTTVRLPGYGGAATDTAAVVAYIQGRNTGSETGSATVQSPGGGFVGGAACSSPALGPVSAGPTTSSLSTESVSSNVNLATESDNILWAVKGENKDPQHVISLTPSEVSAMLQAAIARWAEAGLSSKNLAKIQSLPVEIADLPDGELAVANSSKIVLDATAAGYGWYFDNTPSDDNEFEVAVPDKERQSTEISAADNRIDLLTVLMRQLGTQVSRSKSATLQGPGAWLMENTLGAGTRRAPSFQLRTVGKVQTPQSNTKEQARAASSTQQRDVNNQSVAMNTRRNSRVLRSHAMHVPMTFADVMLSIGTLPAGKTVTITFNVTVNNPFPGPGATVCNQGSVTGTNFTTVLTDDPDVVGTADPTCTPIDLQADLAVTKTDSPDPVIAGTNLTYTINFVNNGPNAAGATVTDATPAGTTFVSASVDTGTGWGTTQPSVGGTGNIVFSKALVAKDETAVFKITVKVNSSVASGSTINNSATAATTGATDPVPGNNTGTASTSVIAQADLAITKTDGVTEKVPGTGVTYTIVVTNNGPSDANGVSVADTFPSDLTGVTFTSTPTGGATGNTAAGSGPISDSLNMPTGSTVTYTVNATVKSSATGTLSNTATVTAPAGVTDNDTTNNSATDNDTLTPQADLSVTKSDGVTSKVPGTSVTYTIVVSNSGPSDAPGTLVADTFPSELTGVSFTSVAAGGATGNTAGPSSADISDTLSLPSGSSVTYTVNATVKSSATGSLSNTATVTAGAGVTDNNTANNSANDTDTLTPQANLSITKTDGSTTATPGNPVTYTIVVSNSGPSDAPGTSVADNFPAILTGVSYTSVAAGGATGNTAGPANGNIGDMLSLPSGASVTYTVNATVQASATGSLSNTATVTAGAGVTDPVPGNNSATDTDTLTASADVSVTKTDSPDPVVVNGNITYTITVTNNGPSDAQSLSLSDAVPANTTLVSVTTPSGWTRTDAVPNGGTGTLTFTRATLPASASDIFTVVV
ncbi:MAG TPA: Ig-like domain-containing protein, partial [Pyrinomonadaceae bacterium]